MLTVLTAGEMRRNQNSTGQGLAFSLSVLVGVTVQHRNGHYLPCAFDVFEEVIKVFK